MYYMKANIGVKRNIHFFIQILMEYQLNHENEKALRQGITIFHIVLVTWVSIEAEMMNKSYFTKTEMNVR